MRPRPSPRHCAKAKLESPLEEDLHGPSTSGDLQGTIIASNPSSTSAGQAGSHVYRSTMSVTCLKDIEKKVKDIESDMCDGEQLSIYVLEHSEKHIIANVLIE